ncbi:hypothetical protein ACN6LA_006275, partial [Streptomyces sp. SAS_269]|uniref:hypothetical protein n=1 Tax=Streptomyces sp. SAS_269 TaxID=3412749 RepID=UPI00403CC8BC
MRPPSEAQLPLCWIARWNRPLAVGEVMYSDSHGGVSLEDAMRDAYEQHDQWRHDDGAPAE